MVSHPKILTGPSQKLKHDCGVSPIVADIKRWAGGEFG
jgi:hypothetical protein